MMGTENLSDTLRELIESADRTATSSAADSFARFDDDRQIGEWCAVPAAIHRDSDTLALSNYVVVCKDLTDKFGDDVLLIERMNHWAVGWTEGAFVPVYCAGPATETGDRPIHPAALLCADWADALADYPVADESHYSELEHEEFCEYVSFAAPTSFEHDGIPYETSGDDWTERLVSALCDASICRSEECSDDDIERIGISAGVYVPDMETILHDHREEIEELTAARDRLLSMIADVQRGIRSMDELYGLAREIEEDC